MSNLSGMTDKMRAYFEKTITDAKAKVSKGQKQIASTAGLCKELDITKQSLLMMEQGSDEEKKFYNDMLLDFELAADAMYSASMVDAKEYGELKKMFRTSGAASDVSVTVVFSKYNNPDDWEDYEDVKRFGAEHEYSIRQVIKLLKKADEAGLKP